ncbi:MAG TPA: dihydrodipicolinate synthase family protein [Bryobacteraceae bacterium]|jgi:4-hydroxy-tetrahydrodipicolinate synthase|nr:dihydrodipicolinate synthase family protein [Bryobacteraceae bacterium]
MAITALSRGSRAADVSRIARSEKKEWAREHLRGLGGLIFPSFTPDFQRLDEEGIRLDVRHSIRQGFTSCTVSANGANPEQTRRIWEIVRAEAAGKIGMGALGGDLAFLEKIGCAYTMIGFPRNAKPETEDEVYEQFRKLIDSTSMAVVLYGSPVESLRRFHPSGIPLNVFSRLADHPNVVGIKLTHPMSVATTFEVCERLSDRLIMGPCNFDHIPLLARHYKNVQWSGLWITDALQSPEKPYAVEMMDLVIQGRLPDAMKVYWQMEPLIQGIYDLQAPLLLHESHPWAHMKYFQWLTGGNGGLLPLKPAQYLPTLDAQSRQTIKDNFRKAGIIPADRPEEEFLVGRTAYEKGVRSPQLSSKPLYA